MSTLAQICTTRRDGSQKQWLDHLGIVHAVTWTSTYPGGDTAFQCRLYRDPSRQSTALQAGRRLFAYNGAGQPAWQGTLSEVEVGDPWTLTAIGIGAAGNDYQAVPAASTNIYWDTDILDQATGRGLPTGRSWTNVNQQMTSSGPPSALETAQQPTIVDALNTEAAVIRQQWQASRIGQIVWSSVPTVPTIRVLAPLPPRTTDGLVTHLRVVYTDSSSNALAVIWVGDDAAAARLDTRIESAVVLSTEQTGSLTAAQATQWGQSILDRSGRALRFRGGIPVTIGQVCSVGGVPIDPGWLRAGICAQLTPQSPTDIATTMVVGQVDYDQDAQTATLTPLNAEGTDVSSILAGLVAETNLAQSYF